MYAKQKHQVRQPKYQVRQTKHQVRNFNQKSTPKKQILIYAVLSRCNFCRKFTHFFGVPFTGLKSMVAYQKWQIWGMSTHPGWIEEFLQPVIWSLLPPAWVAPGSDRPYWFWSFAPDPGLSHWFWSFAPDSDPSHRFRIGFPWAVQWTGPRAVWRRYD